MFFIAKNIHTQMMEDENFKDGISGPEALEIIFKLLDVLTCTECHRVLSPNLTACRNNHIICQTCQRKGAKCAICGRSFISNQAYLIQEILLQMPQECRNSGCPEVVLPGESHQEHCGYRDTVCQLCQAVGACKEIPSHIRNQHAGQTWLGEDTVTTTWEDFHPNKACKKVWPVMIRDQFFWSVMQNDPINNTLSKEYIWLPNGPTTLKVRAKVKFVYQGTQGAHEKEKNLLLNPSLDTDPKPILIGKDDLEHFVETGNVLKWTEIFTVEEPEAATPKSQDEEVKVTSPKSPVEHGVKVILDEFQKRSFDEP